MTPQERARLNQHLSVLSTVPTFRSGLYDLQTANDREIVVEGAAGTGKSFASLYRMWHDANAYPGSRHLLVRKTRASLTDTVLVTLEQEVIPPGHPCLGGAQRANRHSYLLPNGSEIVLGGMDKSTRILSSQYDTIRVPEAIEITEDDYETLLTRMRNGKMPYRQAVCDVNPGAPSHWLNQRAIDGKMRRIRTSHKDNPAYWDGNDWTELGREYVLGTLEKLTGLRRKRYLEGVWASAEGIIYESWDPAIHIVPRFDPPQEWRRVWSLDFGYNHPLVWGSWAVNPDGDMFLHRELFHSRMLIEEAAPIIIARSAGDPRPEVIVADHDAEDRATFERHTGLKTSTAFKAVSSGIQAVQERLKVGPNGRPRIFFMEDTLVHTVDSELKARRVPTQTAQEFESYVWDQKDGQPKGENPVKLLDDGMDMMRYAVAYVDMIDRVPRSARPQAPRGRVRMATSYV